MATLREIINSALTGSEEELKLASARGASPAEEVDFLATELPAPKTKVAHEAGETPAEERAEKKKEEKDKKASREEIFGDADYAMKLAKALRVSSGILRAKIAKGDALSAPGPKVMKSEDHGTTHSPKPQGGVTEKITGGHLPGPASLPTTREDFTSMGDESGAPHNHPGGKTSAAEDWTKSKTASMRLLRAKLAEAETLMQMGQTSAAQVLLDEVKEAQAKLAQDPSSPQPVMPPHGEGIHLDTEPGAATHIPDNAGIISLTKAQAKDPTTREATQHMIGTPKKDNAVAAHTLRTDGLKLSAADPLVTKTAAVAKPEPKPTATTKVASADSKIDPRVARALLASVIKTAHDENADPKDREKAASTLASLKAKLDSKVDPQAALSA